MIDGSGRQDGEEGRLVNRKKSVVNRSWALVIVVGRDRDRYIAR
jgi:hypothetical protein